jgi:small subunit ribosomal protein S7
MKLFGKWNPAEVEIADPCIKGNMNLASKSVMRSGGRHAKQQFMNSEQHIVERVAKAAR